MEAIDYLRFFNSLEAATGKKLTVDEALTLKSGFLSEQKNDAEDELRDLVMAEMTGDSLLDDVVFTKEKLKKITIIELFGYKNIDELSRALKPRRKSRYINLDTYFQDPEFTDKGKHSWRIGFEGKTGDVTLPGPPITKIVGVRMSPFRIHKESVLDFNYGKNFSGRVETLIEEFAAQSFLAPNGRKFHFVSSELEFDFPSDISFENHQTGTSVLFNDGWFWFSNPIQQFSSLTLSYSEALEPTRAFDTKLCGVLVQGSNPLKIEFSQTDDFFYGRITAHPNFYYTLTGFTTGDPTADAALIESVLAYEGPADVFVPVLSYSITFPFDTSGMTQREEPIYMCIHFRRYHRRCISLEFVYEE
jgi:hypothetical protein